MADKRFRIPFEDVRLSEHEVAITQTRTFQRLFDLKQLGLAYLIYPNATHTRGAHSIRCLGEAVKILDGLKNKRSPTRMLKVRESQRYYTISGIYLSVIHSKMNM